MAQGPSSGKHVRPSIYCTKSQTMAVVVNNTFLDVPSHKFLGLEESFGSERRSQSAPRTWKPVSPSTAKPKKSTQKRSLSVSSNCSTGSSFSCCSTEHSFGSSGVSSSCTSHHECLSSPVSHRSRASRSSSLDFGLSSASEHSEAEYGSPSSVCKESSSKTSTRTKLKSGAQAFKPVMAADTRMDAITYAVYLALVSSGKVKQVKVEKGTKGVSATMISAQVQGGSSATCYDTIHMTRQVLEEMTSQLNTVMLLSKRVQKDDCGYSLRSSVACVPCGEEDRVCWDLCKKGSCPRRHRCHWYHPQESDIGRIKVSIRCSDSALDDSSVEPRPASMPVVRHKISLGELVQ